MYPQSILLISHDSIGLGHFRRTLKIAQHLSRHNNNVLVLCSTELEQDLTLNKNITIKTIPGYTKDSYGNYVPKCKINFTLDELIKYRSNFFVNTIKSFKPKVVIVDQKPSGTCFDFEKALVILKDLFPKTRVICGFRDILDDKVKIMNEWNTSNTYNILLKYYTDIWIYGEKNFFDFEQEYKLSSILKKKSQYLGYIQDFKEKVTDYQLPFQNSLPTISFTAGGGEDFGPILKILKELLKSDTKTFQYNTIVILGPYAPNNHIIELEKIQKQNKQLIVIRYIEDLLPVFKQSDVIVSMGGYNSVCEILSINKKPIIISRSYPRKEQHIRATLLAQKGLCEHIPMEKLTKDKLVQKIKISLFQNPIKTTFEFTGLSKLDDSITQWAPL